MHPHLDPSDIPVVILCGGMGTRIREVSERLPKPLVDIGGRPVLWHIMKTYEAHGFRRFVLALGYKSDLIKRYFMDYRHLSSDFTLRMDGQPAEFHGTDTDVDWEITFVETGLTTGTGARIRRVAQHLGSQRFALTYGDGVGAVDVTALLAHHEQAGTVGTLTGVHPGSRYGEMRVDTGTTVAEFNEKPTHADGWVNGGFFLFEREFVERYVPEEPEVMLEHAPLQALARDGQLSMYGHEGFWQGMDTYRDWTELNALWDAGQAPWKTWKD